jgi:DNA-binding MurR/RpiR family transcriptional regulator
MTETLADIPPHAFNELRDLIIIERRDKLPRRLAQVAAYTIEFPDDVAFGTVSSIAERAAVQPSTLVRFAKALGYRGFSELQSVFQQRLRDRPNNYDARLQAFDAHASGHSPAMALIEGLSQAAMRSLERNARVWFEVVESDFEGFRTLAATMTLAEALSIAIAEARRAAAENRTCIPNKIRYGTYKPLANPQDAKLGKMRGA